MCSPVIAFRAIARGRIEAVVVIVDIERNFIMILQYHIIGVIHRHIERTFCRIHLEPGHHTADRPGYVILPPEEIGDVHLESITPFAGADHPVDDGC